MACACGDTHTLCVTSDGALYTFGRNCNGQLGNGRTDDATTPALVEALQVGSDTSANTFNLHVTHEADYMWQPGYNVPHLCSDCWSALHRATKSSPCPAEQSIPWSPQKLARSVTATTQNIVVWGTAVQLHL